MQYFRKDYIYVCIDYMHIYDSLFLSVYPVNRKKRFDI